MRNLKNLMEDTIGTISRKINVKIDIDKTKHAEKRQNRDGLHPISDTEIIEIVNLALPEIASLLIFDEIDMGAQVLIKHEGTGINIVGAIHTGDNEEIDFIVITVMRKKDFIAKSGTKTIRV